MLLQSRWIPAAWMAALVVAGTAAASICQILPNGSFTAGHAGWSIVRSQATSGDAHVSVIAGVDSGESYGLDGAVLHLNAQATAHGSGHGMAKITVSTTAVATAPVLRFWLATSISYCIFGDAGYEVSGEIRIESTAGASAEAPLWPRVAAGTGDGCAPQGCPDVATELHPVELDLAPTGILIGDEVSISLIVECSATAVQDCQSAAAWALLVLDDVKFCDATPPSGDVNEDGRIDVLDLLEVILGWGYCGQGVFGCPADVDRDGVVGAGDVVGILSNWSDTP